MCKYKIKFNKKLKKYLTFFFISYVCKIKNLAKTNLICQVGQLGRGVFMSTKSRYAIVWRVAIIMLIAVFSIAGLTSCGGAATEPTSFSSSDGNGGGTPAPEPTPEPEPEPEVYPEYTYYTVRVPFANSGGYNATAKVSYRDTNELSKLWRAMVKMDGVPGQVFFIRNSGGPFSGQQNTSQYLFSGDNYFYFDDNLNIGYRGVIIKRYKGAAMIPFANQRGTYTVGGVYETAFNGYDGDWGVFGYSGQSQGQAMIMGRTDNRKAGDKDVFVINVTGEKDIGVGRQFNGYGLDVYWKSTRTARANFGRDEQAAAWSQDIRNFIGRDPDGLLRDLDAIHHYGWTGNWAGGNTWMEIHFEAGSDQWGGRGPGG